MRLGFSYSLLFMIMNTKLIFPNTTKLAEFILNNNILKAEVESRHRLMEAELNDDEIILAVAEYEAQVLPPQSDPEA